MTNIMCGTNTRFCFQHRLRRPCRSPPLPPPRVRVQMLAVQSVSRAQFTPTTSTEEALGRELLGLLGRSPSAANAFHLCVQLGLMKHHENLFALEAGIEKVGGCGVGARFIYVIAGGWGGGAGVYLISCVPVVVWS